MSAGSSLNFSRELVTEMIILYKKLPCLWDRSHPGYQRKMEKNAALAKLTALVRRHEPTATRVHVLRKLESLRSCLRREVKRVNASRYDAKREDDVRQPRLWYYDLMKFVFEKNGIANQIVPVERNRQNVIGVKEESDVEAEEAEDEMCREEYLLPEFDDDYGEHIVGLDSGEDHKPIIPDQCSPSQEQYEIRRTKPITEVGDEYDAIGVNVAAKLRGLPANMRIIAEKLINDVLYQAQTNTLDTSTKIVTKDPIKN